VQDQDPDKPAQRAKIEHREESLGPSENDSSNLISNLVDALDAVLKSESTLLSNGTLNRVALARCRALQSELPKPKKTKPVQKTSHQKSKSSSEIIPPQSITPWTSSSIPSTLPPLPSIKDPKLEKSAFTHSGVLTSSAGVQDSYERLEWVGDAYIYLLTTLLISKTFPTLPPGRSAQLRERCLKNETLASYARSYGFEKRYKVPKEFAERAPVVKILGDVFEAYVAAVIYSDPEEGVQRVSEWLKALWAETLAKEIIEQDAVAAKEQVGTAIPAAAAKQELAKQIMSRGIRLSYKDVGVPGKDPATGFPLYTVGVYLDGWGEKNKLLGTGTALGKKEAGSKAAEMALGKDLYVYKEKKRIFDEMNKAKKDAEEAAKNS